MTFNNTGDALIRHEYARRIEASEALEILQKAYENNLVQCGENVREDVSFICNCCGCCCEGLQAARKLGFSNLQTTNYIPQVEENSCIGCGKCVRPAHRSNIFRK